MGRRPVCRKGVERMRHFTKLGTAALAGAICLPLAAFAAAPDTLDRVPPHQRWRRV